MKAITIVYTNYTATTSEIKTRTDIIALISESVQLIRKGNNYWGLCPFHAEKTPSFSVSRDKQRFRCWGCGAAGDVFDFIRLRDGVPFQAAKSYLAARAGIGSTAKLTPTQFKKSKNAEKQRQLVKEKTANLEAILWNEYKRLVEIEKWIWHILRTVTGPGDYNRPAVIWALDNRDMVESLLNEWHVGNDIDRLGLMRVTGEVRLWGQN